MSTDGLNPLGNQSSTHSTWPVFVWPYNLLMTHKYRGCIVVLSINKSVEPNEEQKVLTSSFEHGIIVNTSRQVFRVFLYCR